MSISELIKAVGDENIEVQALHESFVSANATSKGATISFATHPHKVRDLDKEKQDFVCLILWLPRNKIPDQPKETNVGAGSDSTAKDAKDGN